MTGDSIPDDCTDDEYQPTSITEWLDYQLGFIDEDGDEVEFEDWVENKFGNSESSDDLTKVSGVDDEEAELLNAAGFETLDDLREATQHELANIRIGNALAARIKADVGGAEASFKDFFGISQEEADAFREVGLKAISDSSEETQDELDDLFNPDEEFPPRFHLDYLEEEKLEFNLGQIDGFLGLDWETKCDLAEFAVDHDLDRSSTQEVLDAYLAYDDSADETELTERQEEIRQMLELTEEESILFFDGVHRAIDRTEEVEERLYELRSEGDDARDGR